MRVEITEKKLRDMNYNLLAGDIVTVPDEVGKTWCRRGWAKDTEGVVPTGERIVRGEGLEVQSAKHKLADTNSAGGA